MKSLSEYGFEEAGEWHIYGNVKSGINFRLRKFENERVIYAFVVDGEVKYIGICLGDFTTLTERLGRYKSMIGGSTNERVASLIRECLEQSKNVRIYALKPELECKYGDLDVDLVRGLESPLVNRFDPEWNIA